MDEPDYDARLAELDRILNDPDSKMEPARVWSLLAEIAEGSAAAAKLVDARAS